MGRKAQISLVAIVFTAIVATLLVYLWDQSRADRIAEGVTIGGIDVGGLEADAARAQVEKNLLDPIDETVTVEISGADSTAELEVAALERLGHRPTLLKLRSEQDVRLAGVQEGDVLVELAHEQVEESVPIGVCDGHAATETVVGPG